MRIRLDPFVVALLAAAGLASVLPVNDSVAAGMSVAAKLAIGLLFFLYGARLSAADTWGGLRNWRLHGLIAFVTFAFFPLLGAIGRLLSPSESPLFLGLLFLCALPSTVQSSVAATALARGNTAAAIVSASASNLLSVVLTPLLVAALISGTAQSGLDLGSTAQGIVFQLLLPFAAGQASRPLTAAFMARYRDRISIVDRTGIIIIVFIAFAAGRRENVWSKVEWWTIAALIIGLFGLLVLVFWMCWRLGSLANLPYADRVALLFCGSQKSLTTGLPIAGIMFPAAVVPLVILPVMMYHQLQLMAAAWLAPRLRQSDAG